MTCIAVVGAAKSGTSALFAAIRRVGDWVAIYEMTNRRQLTFLTSHPAPQRVTKILLGRVVSRNLDLAAFDRRVYLVRDPRDLLVSWMLFRPLLHDSMHDEAFMTEFLAALRRKEADPASVSIADLEAIYLRRGLDIPFADRLRGGFRDEQAVLSRFPDMHVLRFEDFLDGKVGAVSHYLGTPIPTRVSVGEHVGHVERSKSAGGWRHWFTPADVATYQPVFAAQLARHGYDLEWTLPGSPRIDPATSSEYLERNRDRPRLIAGGRGELLSSGSYTPERLSVLASGVTDGREAAMVELALVHLRRIGRPRNFAAAREMFDDAAARGDAHAMIYRGLGARYRVPGFGSDARVHFDQAARVVGRRRRNQMVLELDRTWRRHVLPDAGLFRGFMVPSEPLRVRVSAGLRRARRLRSRLPAR